MANSSFTIITFYTIFFFLRMFPSCKSSSFETCSAICGAGGRINLTVRFPFSLVNGMAGADCGLPGFGLRCKRLAGPTSAGMALTLELPYSGEFVVRSINYTDQTISINDPDNCLPKRFLGNFNVSGSPFRPIMDLRYTFYNCTSGSMVPNNVSIACLSHGNYNIMATLKDGDTVGKNYSNCREISTVLIPYQEPSSPGHRFPENLGRDVILTWDLPMCRNCEEKGRSCGYKRHGSDRLVGCLGLSYKSNGTPKAAKYILIVGPGIAGLITIIGLACFVCRRIQAHSQRPGTTSVDFTALAGLYPTFLSAGLDGPTIESYPKTQLGESKRLPKPNDTTCSICLCEYEPKETLRTMPECSHYFHVACIDEWLRLNGTCPLCRSSPESSVARSSVASSSTVSASSA